MENRKYPIETACPSCGSSSIETIYQVKDVPVHSVLLLDTVEEALSYPRGDISLEFCQACGFIYNSAFKPELHEYSSKYEATQGYSATFNAFHRRLAMNLIERYDIREKSVVEIGCGQGEFLSLLCELGGNRGVGFDPAYVPERSQVHNPSSRLSFIQDFYSEKYAQTSGDFVCCKMTLEHIQNTADFIRMMRRSLNGQKDALVFFQVPNARYVLGEAAFWDIYYEHCSYFSLGSIARLFRSANFDIQDLWTDYDDQYLMITARVNQGGVSQAHPKEDDLQEVAEEVAAFRETCIRKKRAWKAKIGQINQEGRRVVLWGGGSKAVAFLTTLGIGRDQLPYAVDINPHKRGTFIAGTGQEIISPEQLALYPPDAVVVMNPVYCREVEEMLAGLGLAPEMLSVQSY
jgi:SAM-dependent methyltransferase